MISRDEALGLVKERVRNYKLVKHMIAVSVIMRGLAEHLGENSELWEVVGLVHDIDYKTVGDDFDRHGIVSAEIMSGVLPEAALHAIKAHNHRTKVPVKSRMDIALIAADALSGLIVATALMMPDKKLATIKVKSLRRKFNDGSFARNINRNNISRCNELSLTLKDFFALGLKSMQSVSDELAL